MTTVTVSSKGQIVLPKQLREELEIREGDRVELRREENRIVLELTPRSERPRHWQDWRGSLAGTSALEEHLREHREESER